MILLYYVFTFLYRQECYFLQIILLKHLKWVSSLSQLIYLEPEKKVLGSPLTFFLKAALYIHIVPFYSLVPI